MSRHKFDFWVQLAMATTKPPMVVLFKRDWRGMENIPQVGGFIAVVNHNSYLDPLAYAHYQYSTGRFPHFLAKEALFRTRFIGPLLRGTGQIPVYRESADAASAFRAAVAAVDRGECVVFHPEGTLTRDEELWPMAGKTGAARLALLTKAPVIPVAHWGVHEALPPYGKPNFFPRKTVHVLAGPPVDLSEFYDKEPTPEVLRDATNVIMDAITALLEELRGEKAPAERITPQSVRALQRKKSAERREARPGSRRRARPGTPGAVTIPFGGGEG